MPDLYLALPATRAPARTLRGRFRRANRDARRAEAEVAADETLKGGDRRLTVHPLQHDVLSAFGPALHPGIIDGR